MPAFSDALIKCQNIGACLDVNIRDRVAIVVLCDKREIKIEYAKGENGPFGKLWPDVLAALDWEQ